MLKFRTGGIKMAIMRLRHVYECLEAPSIDPFRLSCLVYQLYLYGLTTRNEYNLVIRREYVTTIV